LTTKKKISGQNNGNLNNYDLEYNKKFFKSSLLKNVCSKFDEESKYITTSYENNWFYDVLSVEPAFHQDDFLFLKKVDSNIKEEKTKNIDQSNQTKICICSKFEEYN